MFTLRILKKNLKNHHGGKMIPKSIESIAHRIACECFILVLVILCLSLNCVNSGSVNHKSSPRLTPVNCSEYCTCRLQDVQEVINHHYESHNSFAGSKYGDELSSYSDYMDFLGIFSMVVAHMVEISCTVDDGRVHTVSSFLNGIENEKYTSLQITCRAGETVIWDVIPSMTSFNIFESQKCSVVPDQVYSRDVVIPMNMWIFKINNVGDSLMSQVDTRFTINTLVLSIEGTDTFTIPDKWAGDAMISLERLNLQSNKLKRFECKIQFTKNLDTINLSNNELVKFPKCLLKDNLNIHFLSLSHNAIYDISAMFTDVPFRATVELIDLSFNSIQKIGNFKPMNKLVVLDLSNNQISEINDDAFNQLTDLKQLYLQNNQIHFIAPVAFRENINLGVLKLKNNLIKSVRLDQFPATNKVQIDLRKNKLRLPPFTTDMKKRDLPPTIEVLSAQNPFHCDCHMIVYDEYTSLMDNGSLNTTPSMDFYLDQSEMKCTSPRANKGRTINEISFVKSCIVIEGCPQTCQCSLLNKSEFVVNCSSRRFLELPETIPVYPGTKLIVDLSRNPLQLLGYRNYLHKINSLYIDNCLLTSVTPAAIEALQNVEELRLHNNLLYKLPANTKNITLRSASNLTLHNNRWACSCDDLWLPQWISTHRGVLWKPGTIVCNYLQKPIEEFNPSDVNCEGYSSQHIILAITLILSSVLSSICILFYFGKDIKLLLYSKLRIRLTTDFSYGDEFTPYDAFISYGQDSYKWVVDTLVPNLEDGTKKFKLCLHYRDFPPGESNVENVPWAIRLSRSSILVLSKDFMKKEWCILELRSVFQRLLMASNKLLIIVTDDVSPEDLTPDLRAYMNTHDYLRTDESFFWEKLELFLPEKDVSDGTVTPSPEVGVHEGSGDTELNHVLNPDVIEPHTMEGEPSFISVKTEGPYEVDYAKDERS